MLSWKSLFKFKKRDSDWWISTLLPLIIISALAVFYFFTKGLGLNFALSTLITETLIYSIVLSSTDLALRSRIDKEDRMSRSAPLIPLIFGVLTIAFYELSDPSTAVLPNLVVLTVWAMILGYISLNLYNNNPESGEVPDPVTQKEEQDKKDLKEFEPGVKNEQ